MATTDVWEMASDAGASQGCSHYLTGGLGPQVYCQTATRAKQGYLSTSINTVKLQVRIGN